ERDNIYGERDDFERFAFLSRAAIALLKRLEEAPDILHCNDWPCGFASIEMRTRRQHEAFFAKTKILFSIHNLAYQGIFDPSDLRWLEFAAYTDAFMLKGAASALKAGIIPADALSTVSPRYAQEIQTPEQGYGLDWLLRARRDRLVGITNGVDYELLLQRWHDSAPHQVGIYKGYAGEPLAHQIEAGADIFLMPSLYEPCGLNQMYSMRYGTVPVVRATGGLDDTVENFNPETGKGNGLKFGPYSASAMLEKIREAIYFYSQPDIWAGIQRNGIDRKSVV